MTLKTTFTRTIEEGLGIAVAILFWFIVVIIAIVATASSKSPWDTVIAAMAMISQAFFAYMVWRLGKNQYAYAQQVSERQHKIDMYPLREDAARKLEKAAKFLTSGDAISDDYVEAIRLCHLEIKRLFSDEADLLAFELYELAEQADRFYRLALPVLDDGGSIAVPGDAEMATKCHNSLDNAYDILTDLRNAIDHEMRIR